MALLTTDSREHYRDYRAPVPSFGAAPEALLEGFAMLDEVEVHVISCVRQPVNSPERLARNVFYHSLLVPKIGWMTSGYQGCIRAVRRKLREINPHIVHGQGTERDCAMEAVFSGSPNVLTIHGNMAELGRLFKARIGSFHWLAAKLENFALSRTAGVFCNSAYTESLVKPRAKKVWRVANAVRSIFFQSSRPSQSSEVPVIVNVGLISPRKRQNEILDLAADLFREGTRPQFHFIGHIPDDDYGREFRQKIEAGERTGYARYLGTKSAGELVKVFDDSAAMIHFPIEESFGLVVAEALARNLKFFGSAVGGIVDISQGIEMAELHPANDFLALEKGIMKWMKEGCCKPTAAAPAMRERYHPGVIAARHLEIYRSLV